MEFIFAPKVCVNELVDITMSRLLELRKNGAVIQAQPLGIMRLALEGQKNCDAGLFLHFWASDLPKSMVVPPLHTHVFHLKSRVLKGGLRDTMLKAIPDNDGDFQLVDSQCNQDHCAIISSLDRVRMKVDQVREISAGEIYEVPKGKFHVTALLFDHEPTITIMEKSKIDTSNPVLALPLGFEIDRAPFDRTQLDQKVAWSRLMGALNEFSAPA